MTLTPFDLAMRFVGTKEVAGVSANPLILAMLTLDQAWPKDDAVPWCSGFLNLIAWLCRLPRSKSLAARSWLLVGRPIPISEAKADSDVVILTRAGAPKDASVINAAGHVGFFAGCDGNTVTVLGGNQGDQVSLARFPVTDVLGVRRLA